MKNKWDYLGGLGRVFGGVLLGLALSAASATATERELLRPAAGDDASVLSSPAGRAQLDALVAAAQANGSVRVIVGLSVPFAPEGKLSEASASEQRTEIAAAQQEVLSTVPSLKSPERHPKIFQTIPFMAIEATQEELRALSKMRQIVSIEEDRLAAPTLAQSVPLIGATDGKFSGFDGSGQVVAILDTGVDKNHPDLAGRVVSEACYSTTYIASGAKSLCPGGVSSSVATDSAMPYATGICTEGACDHGTHVAGIAAGAQGVAQGAKIIAIQVFSLFPASHASCGGTPCALTYNSDYISGLERVNALKGSFNIASANMSLGGGDYTSNCDLEPNFLSTKSIIDTLRSHGIATVIASGNSGYDNALGAPACISSAISVGATWDTSGDSNGSCGTALVDSVACFSNSADFLNLLAPGVWINAPIPGGGYGNWQGTSMAAPHVAGAWAVLKQKNSSASVDDVLNAFSSTGKSVTDVRNGITKPRIQVVPALNALPADVSYKLSVALLGTGSGNVKSDSGGIDCGSSCLANYNADAVVTLTAQPASDSIFTGWGGSCAGTATSCTVTMSAVRSVTAIFDFNGVNVTALDAPNLSGDENSLQYFSVDVPSGAINLKVETSGGTGDVDLYMRRDEVPTRYVYDCVGYRSGNEETCVDAKPLAGTYYIMLDAYVAFSGVTLKVTYQIPAAQNYTLSVSRQGSGSGTVTSVPSGIDCGGVCSASYAVGTVVTLTAQAAPDSVFTGWEGACTGAGACAVGMSEARTVRANFGTAPKHDATDISNIINFLLLN